MPTFAKPVVATLLLLAWASGHADPVAIAEAYEMHDVADADAAEAMGRCIGNGATDAKGFIANHSRPGDNSHSELTSIKDATGAVVASGPFWSCVTFSRAGFPVWPVEALTAAIAVRGVEPAVQSDWARKVLARVAAEGEGSGLVILANGDGLEFKVIAEQHRASIIHYTSRRIPKGEIDQKRYVAVIDDPHLAGMTTTRMGSDNDASLPAVFALPSSRLRKPLDGEYVRERPDDLTTRFDFTGTRWQFGTKPTEPVLELQADGQAVETTNVGGQPYKINGTWRVEAGVLHIALGNAHFSLVLVDGQSLAGDARRKLLPSETAMDPARAAEGDFRWALKLRRA